VKQIQTVEPAEALAKAFGLKGRVTVQLDDIIIPTTEVGSLEETPFQQWTPCTGETQQPASGAGNYSFISVEPGNNKILGVFRIDVVNLGAGAQSLHVRLMAPSNIAAVTTSATAQLLAGVGHYTASTTPPRTTSLVRRGLHTAVAGNGVARITCLANTMASIEFPGGFFMDGNDPNGVAALTVWDLAANEALTACFYCKEFRVLG